MPDVTPPDPRPPAVAAFLARVGRNAPVAFADTLALIDSHYGYRPTAFDNGLGGRAVHNAAERNQGSCRVFAFARLHGLDERLTLACFGEHHRQVLATPGGADHANIRAFMRHGRAGVRMHGEPLTPRRDAGAAQ